MRSWTFSKPFDPARTRKLAHSALYIAGALILPQLFHLFGLGKLFLPMHLPIIFGGIMLGWRYGLLIGAISPILSALLFGMPPLLPYGIMMMFELAIAGCFSGLFFRLFREEIFATLIVTTLAARLLWGFLAYLLLPLLGLERMGLFAPVTLGIVTCWPGVLIQFMVIPPILAIMKKMKRA